MIRQKAEDRRQKIEDRRQKTEGKRDIKIKPLALPLWRRFLG